jgi:cytochrome bd ubiquinol oxidase subunit II
LVLEIAVAACLAGALLLFALAGGADFGGGMWSFAARGEGAEEEMKLIDRAIGPIWEANELWIVVAIVILWSGFPSVFSALGISLFVPLIFVLVGIVLRGAMFSFQEHSAFAPFGGAFMIFGRAYGGISVLAPFFFGLVAGTIASGRIRFDSSGSSGRFALGHPAGGYFEPWLGPFAIACGVLALAICAYLATVYMTVEAEDSPELRETYRRRGLVTGTVLGILGIAVLPIMSFDAEYMWREIWRLPSIIFMGAAAISLVCSLVLLYLERYWWARTATIAHVASIFCAWVLAQYPYLIVPDITIRSASAPTSVLIALLILSFFYAVVLGPSLALMFYLFKRRPSQAPEPSEVQAEAE